MTLLKIFRGFLLPLQSSLDDTEQYARISCCGKFVRWNKDKNFFSPGTANIERKGFGFYTTQRLRTVRETTFRKIFIVCIELISVHDLYGGRICGVCVFFLFKQSLLFYFFFFCPRGHSSTFLLLSISTLCTSVISPFISIHS